MTLIGPNGSGKSTILKSITRQLKVVGGNVFFDDTSLLKLPYKELASKMAVVLTDRIKTELMTCHDIVATGRYPYTGRLGILTQEDECLVEEAMQAVHAQELGNRDFNAISDGQKQRVLLARAICQDPDVIVLDEPTSFLDVKYKLELLSILERMARQKKITVIMSLHEIDLAQKISDKIICVKGETISHYGSPEEVFTEEIIRELYGINNGYFDPLFGSIELPAPEGEPKVFVISSGGTGIPVYRRLQKEHIPFAAGILYENGEIKKREAFASLGSCGGLTRTDDLWVMSPTSYQLLHSAMLFFCSCGGLTRTDDLWVMSPTSYQLLHSAMLFLNCGAKVRALF